MHITICVNQGYRHLRPFITRIPKIFKKEGETIYLARNEIKKMQIEDTAVVVKSFRIPLFINRIIYTFFRKSKAHRSYHHSILLRNVNIMVPAPVAFIEIYRTGLLAESYFINEECPYPHVLRETNDNIVTGRQEMLAQLAQLLISLHLNHFELLDLTNGNVLYDDTDGQIRFALVDLNRMKRRRLTITECLTNIHRIVEAPEVAEYIFRKYLELRHWDETEWLPKVVEQHREFYNMLTEKRRKEHARTI